MSKNFLTNDEHRAFNEIVFENRNKAYGAYALRTEANVLLQRAFFTGMAIFAAIALVPLVINKLKSEPKIVIDHGPVTLESIDVHTFVKPKPIIAKPNAIDQTKKQRLDTPEPKRDAVNDQTINPKDKDALISTVDSKGTPVDNQNPVTDKGSGFTAQIDNTPKVDPNAIPAVVDVEAGFVGGIETFRSKVLQNFDTGAVESESGELIKGIITFVVEKDGSITNIKASSSNADFNKEAEKTIKNIKGKWMPAKLKGQAVRSYFRFPISMQFD